MPFETRPTNMVVRPQRKGRLTESGVLDIVRSCLGELGDRLGVQKERLDTVCVNKVKWRDLPALSAQVSDCDDSCCQIVFGKHSLFGDDYTFLVVDRQSSRTTRDRTEKQEEKSVNVDKKKKKLRDVFLVQLRDVCHPLMHQSDTFDLSPLRSMLSEPKSACEKCLFVFGNAFSRDVCTSITDHFSRLEREGSALITKTYLADNNNVSCLSLRSDLTPFDDDIYAELLKISGVLGKTFHLTIDSDTGFELRKIFGPTRLHVDGPNRMFSVIVALNDDDAAEIVFPLQRERIKLSKGDVLVFPPYWTHPHFVTNPSRYRFTITTWFVA